MTPMKQLNPILFPLILLVSGTALAASPTASLEQNVFVPLAKKLVPSVVNIQTTTTLKTPYGQGGGGPQDLFRKFFEDMFKHQNGGVGPRNDQEGGGDEEDQDLGPPPHGGPLPKAMSLGTGFIIDASGLVLTNNHVVADADEIKIQFTEEEEEVLTDGEVVGRDLELDVALIKVKTKRDLVPVVLGDSDDTQVGEYVMAVGNPFGQGHSVTHGIISAKGREAPELPLAGYLQTDAPINPGNSGGPLVNLKGEVIGINNAIDQRAQGIGFAIPINVVKKILPQLKTKGTVARGYIGVLVNELTPDIAPKLGVAKDLHAPFVTHVYPGDPADKAGLKPYDIITSFGGKTVKPSSISLKP
jgi:serine protease Do